MIEGVFCIAGAGLLWCGIGLILSSVVRDDVPVPSFLAGAYLLGSILAWIIVPDYSTLDHYTMEDLAILVVLILLSGVSVSGGIYCSTLAMRRGAHGTAWSIAQSALIIPFLFSIVFLGDRASFFSILGIVLVMFGIGIIGHDSNRPNETSSSRAFLWALAAFLLIGIQQTLTIVPSRFFQIDDVARLRVPLMGTGSLLFYSVFALRRGGLRPAKPLRMIALASLYIASQLFLFRAIDIFSIRGLTAYIYPWAISINIISFLFLTFLIHKEAPNRFQVIALLFIVSGILIAH